MSEPTDPIRVLIFYQYPREGPGSTNRPDIVKNFHTLLGEKTIDGRSIDRRYLKDAPRSQSGPSIFASFEGACDYFDYVVAIVTHDARPASLAGNLWFETGFWIARHGGDRLLLVRHVTGNDETDAEVALPSSITNFPFEEAREPEKIFELLDKKVRSVPITWRGEGDGWHADSIHKVKQVLKGTTSWASGDFRVCRDSRAPTQCPRVLPTLTAIAWLARFCEAADEARELAAGLEELRGLGEGLLSWIRSAKTPQPRLVRKRFLDLEERATAIAEGVRKWKREAHEDQWGFAERVRVFMSPERQFSLLMLTIWTAS